MEDSQKKGYSFLGNNMFPNLNDALVYERKFKENIWIDKFHRVKFIENRVNTYQRNIHEISVLLSP